MGSSVTQEELGVEPLLLKIERRRLRRFGHLFQMSAGGRGVLGMSHQEDTARTTPRNTKDHKNGLEIVSTVGLDLKLDWGEGTKDYTIGPLLNIKG